MRTPIAAALLAGLVTLAASSAAAQPAPEPLDRSAERLQALIRLDTTDPPGKEAAAAELVAGWLREEGITPTLYTCAPGREAVVARLTGDGSERPLLLLAHLDVVATEPTRWHHAPFAGEIADGKLWGRGTLDMKGLAVMELEAFLALKRRGVKLRRDVILAFTPDEEAGGEQGAGWLLAHHPEAVECGELLNEGATGLVTPNGGALMGIQTAERGTVWVRVTASGPTGHGAQEWPNSATRHLVRALARLEAAPRRYEIGDETRPMIQTLAGVLGGFEGFVLGQLTNPLVLPFLAPPVIQRVPFLAPVLSMTINPNVLAAGSKVNVVPGTATAEIDMRILPGHTPTETLAWLRGVLADPALDVQIIHAREPSRSAPDGSLYHALAAASAETYPGVPVTPILTPGGGTDSPYFRQRGTKAYGCMPILATREQVSSIHGDDEYITLMQLIKGTRVVSRAVELSAAASP